MPHHPLARAEVPGEENVLLEVRSFSATGNRSHSGQGAPESLSPRGHGKQHGPGRAHHPLV